MNDETRLALVERDVSMLKDAVFDIKDSTKKISEYLSTLTILEQAHSETRRSLERSFNEIYTLRKETFTAIEIVRVNADSRIGALELEQPVTQLVGKWVIGLIVGCMALVGLAVWKLIIR